MTTIDLNTGVPSEKYSHKNLTNPNQMKLSMTKHPGTTLQLFNPTAMVKVEYFKILLSPSYPH